MGEDVHNIARNSMTGSDMGRHWLFVFVKRMLKFSSRVIAQ